MRARWGHFSWLLVVSLFLTSCGAPALGSDAEGTLSISALGDESQYRSPLVTPSAPPAEIARRVDLVVLHTNDNWGETEPCG
jgi:hypothetical protein